MGLEKAMKNLKFDSRMTEWNLRQGQLSEKELKEHLNALPDCAENVVKLQEEIEHEEDEDMLDTQH